MSSHLDSSPESSENGTEAPLTPKGEDEFTVLLLTGSNIVASCDSVSDKFGTIRRNFLSTLIPSLLM